MDKAKAVYLKNKFQPYNTSTRSTSKLTNSIHAKSKKNSHDLSINQTDTFITDDLQLANIFNNYFYKIGSELSQ